MTPEQIVRALAAADPIREELCALCGAWEGHNHKPDCPWQQAAAWVASADAPVSACPVCGARSLDGSAVGVGDLELAHLCDGTDRRAVQMSRQAARALRARYGDEVMEGAQSRPVRLVVGAPLRAGDEATLNEAGLVVPRPAGQHPPPPPGGTIEG